MKRHERILYINGIDSGVREDNAGNVYIDKEVYFEKGPVKEAVKILKDIDI